MRVIKLYLKNNDPKVDGTGVTQDVNFDDVFKRMKEHMDKRVHNRALEVLWEGVNSMNQYVNTKEPWKVKEDPQALNTYAYSRNNPVVLVDKDGNFYQLFTGAIGAVVGAVWGAKDAYNLVKYTVQGDFDKASQSSERFVSKVGLSTVAGLAFGVMTQPLVATYAPGVLAGIS